MILNEAFLREEARKIPNLNKYEILLENEKFDTSESYDLFISHSFKDRDLVEVLYNKFKDAGYKVYIDWKEEILQNRKNVSSETAKILRKHMNNCSGLSYIATDNVTSSKWCPWELGYADGRKNRAAILPITKENHYEYKGLEYLGIYPYIDYDKIENSNRYEFWVNDSSDKSKYSPLRHWLDTGELKKH